MSWPIVRVGEIAEQVRGVAYPKSDVWTEARPGTVPLLRASNIVDGEIELSDLLHVSNTHVREHQMLRSGDILIATSSGSLSAVGKAAQAQKNFSVTFGAFCKVVRPKPAVYSRYIGHFFQTPGYRSLISSLASGANINNIRNEHIDNLEIALPPFPEQRRVATILDQAGQLRRQAKSACAKIKALDSAIFNKLFGDLGRFTASPLGELVESQRIGLVRASDELGDDKRYPYVRMNAIGRDGDILMGTLQTTDASLAEVGAYALRDGDFLFNTRNSRELVGKTAVWRGHGDYLFNNNIMRIRFKPEFSSDFAQFAFSDPTIRHQIETRKTGTTSVFAVYWRDLKTLLIPVPPSDLQATFSEHLIRTSALKKAARQRLDYLDSLFASLQRRAFQGEL